AAQFRKWQRRTAMRRLGRAQLLRNVAVALGNTGTAAELEPLGRALAEPSPLVRAHAAWAIGEIGRREAAPRARELLTYRRAVESDPAVSAEIDAALAS